MVCGHGVNERWFLDILWCSEEFSEKKHGFSFLTTQPVQSSHWCIHLAASKLDQVLRIVWQHFFQGVSQITTMVCPSGIFLGMQGMDPKLKTLRVVVCSLREVTYTMYSLREDQDFKWNVPPHLHHHKNWLCLLSCIAIMRSKFFFLNFLYM